MAKTSTSLRLDPHEVHIVREALRLYDYILEWQMGNPDVPPPDFDFNFGHIENPSVVRMKVNEVLVEMGGDAPRVTPRPQTRQGPPHQTGDLNIMRNFKHSYRMGRTLKRAMKL